MTQFDQFDISRWQPDGVLLAPAHRRRAPYRRRGQRSVWTLVAASLVFAAGARTTVTETSASSVAFTHCNVAPAVEDGDRVPDGYWRGLMAKMRALPAVTEAPGADPEPFI
jgi:hypothetical protein